MPYPTPTTSGTISQTRFQTRLVIEHAYRRCRLNAQAITGEMIDVAFDELYLMLSEWANGGIQLWCIEKWVLPLVEGQAQLPLPIGTVDILNTNLRQTTKQVGVVDQTNPAVYMVTYPVATQITTIGLVWTSAPVQISIESSQDGITWTVWQTLTPVIAAPNGVRTWTDIDGTNNALYWRVQTMDGTPLPISDFYLGNTPYEITMARLNRDDYINLPNKTFQGRPLQYWYDRQRDIPLMTLWPAPIVSYIDNQITIWRKRYIMDVGNANNLLDIPQRWYDAVIYGLAVKLAETITAVDRAILPDLAAKAQSAFIRAQAEERDNSPIYWTPNLRVYTR